MTPYYEHAGIQIFHGDCREILPLLSPVDLVLTDPPYPGMTGGLVRTFSNLGKVRTPNVTVGDPWQASLDWIDLLPSHLGAVVFCSYHSVDRVCQALPGRRVLVGAWHKTNPPPAFRNVPQYSLEFYVGVSRATGLQWGEVPDWIELAQDMGGCVSRGERIRNTDGSNTHPTQKPEGVMRPLIMDGANLVLDPFCGTGTTLVIAKEKGRRAIGIEIEEKYVQIAIRRLEQEVLQFPQDEKPRTAVQGSLLEGIPGEIAPVRRAPVCDVQPHVQKGTR